jgi:hypothetical protein
LFLHLLFCSATYRQQAITFSTLVGVGIELSPIGISLKGGKGERSRLLTDPIFLDRFPDPDPFEKLDLIPPSDPLAFSGSPIRSDLAYRSIWLLKDQKYFSFWLGKIVLTENA